MFRLASPLFLVLLVPIAAVLWTMVFKRSKAHLKVPSLNGIQKSPVSLAAKLRPFADGLKILALILLVAALARPQWGNKKINVTTEGINIVLALDLSESMRALDFKKDDQVITRLQAVKHVVSDFILKREGDRIGMVVFGSNAFTQLPLTRDYNTISFILDKLQIGAAGPRTAIGDAIGISLKRLEDIKSKSNIIILLTDGKSNSGELFWQDAAKIAADRKVRIYTIGVGTKGEAPFLVDGLFGRRYVYQKVDVDLDALKQIAGLTQGRFFKADDLDGLKEIYQEIDRLEKTRVKVDKWVAYKEWYPPFVITALLLLLIHLVLVNTRLLRIP